MIFDAEEDDYNDIQTASRLNGVSIGGDNNNDNNNIINNNNNNNRNNNNNVDVGEEGDESLAKVLHEMQMLEEKKRKLEQQLEDQVWCGVV